jgi:NTE family protein
MNIGIALGGGGARGLAHIGVLEVLEEHDIKPSHVAGTSIGSIIGAIYCLQGSAVNLRVTAKKIIESDEFGELGLDRFYTKDNNIIMRFKKEIFEKLYFGTLLFKQSHLHIDTARAFFNKIFNDKTFNDCRVKFACSALDIETGSEMTFQSGLLSTAVRASCAIPGIFPPYPQDGAILVDGGFTSNIPIVSLKKSGVKVVIAVYLGDRPRFTGEPNTGYRIGQRMQSFIKYHLDQHMLKQADFTINPPVSDFHWADFASFDTLVEQGRTAALRSLEPLKKIRSWWYRLRRMASLDPRRPAGGYK